MTFSPSPVITYVFLKLKLGDTALIKMALDIHQPQLFITARLSHFVQICFSQMNVI